MAMLPFIGYNAGDYFSHWIEVGKDADADKLPRIFYVNWFRRDEDGDVSLAGVRRELRASSSGPSNAWRARRPPWRRRSDTCRHPSRWTPTGSTCRAEDLQAALAVDVDEWRAEIPEIEAWFAEIGDSLPVQLQVELDGLKARLGLG